MSLEAPKARNSTRFQTRLLLMFVSQTRPNPRQITRQDHGPGKVIAVPFRWSDARLKTVRRVFPASDSSATCARPKSLASAGAAGVRMVAHRGRTKRDVARSMTSALSNPVSCR